MPALFCDLHLDVHLQIVYHLEFDEFNALRIVRCPSLSTVSYLDVFAPSFFDQCNRKLHETLDKSSVWNHFARRLASQGIPLPYEGLEIDAELSTQDLKRVVLKAFRREKAWSRPYSTPKPERIQIESGKLRIIKLEKFITSDLLAIIGAVELKFLRLSDYSFIDAFEFPSGAFLFDDYHKVEYDHRKRTIYAFAIAAKQK